MFKAATTGNLAAAVVAIASYRIVTDLLRKSPVRTPGDKNESAFDNRVIRPTPGIVPVAGPVPKAPQKK